MNTINISFHHLGLAVSNPEKATFFLKNLGYRVGNKVYDEKQNVNLIMCHGNGMPDVEVIFPSATEGPLDKMLLVRKEIIYHICYRTSNTNKTIEEMKSADIRLICVSPPKPAILFENHLVSFYQVVGFGLIELLEQ